MQAGRWKSNRMPMRYGEHGLAGRGGMARAVASQGQDKALYAIPIDGGALASPKSVSTDRLIS
jgi:hypothetical protein